MEWPQWLQGGPFLEVSFLLELNEKKTKVIREIVTRLSELTKKVEVVDENVDEIIEIFDKGYPYDEEDHQSIILHSLKLRLYVYLSKKRKSTLQIEMVSANALIVNFQFFGDEFDVPEWDQFGIKKDEFSDFIHFLKNLYNVYEFKIGGIAIEEDVLELFGCDEIYPNECFRYENLSPDYFLKAPSPFFNIIWNGKYKKLRHIPYNYKRLPKEGVLIQTGIFTI